MIRYRLICHRAEVSAPEKSRARTAAPARAAKPGTAATEKSLRQRSKTVATAGCGYEFESWFQNSDAYESLAKRGAISCPQCGSTEVGRALMAPSVKTTKAKPVAQPTASPPSSGRSRAGAGADVPQLSDGSALMATLTPEQRTFVETMRKVRDHVLSSSEDVGPRFVEEARKMHYEETETRSIRGEASIEDARALAEEGIDVFPIPVLPDDRN